jgi:hypothetical protein
MIRTLGALLSLVLIPLLLAEPQGALQTTPGKSESDAAKLNGVWALSLDPKQSSVGFDTVPGRRKVVVFKSAGTDVQVSDPETKTTSSGKAYDATKFSFTFPVKTESSGSTKPVVFNGSVSGDTISGTTTVGGVDVRWQAVKLLSAWECSNHKNPSHIATSEDEMRSLTKQYMCVGWHKVK